LLNLVDGEGVYSRIGELLLNDINSAVTCLILPIVSDIICPFKLLILESGFQFQCCKYLWR